MRRIIVTQTGNNFVVGGHLKYELQMLIFAFYQRPKSTKGALQNALLEVFLLHARNLLDFIRSKDGTIPQARAFQTEIDRLGTGCQTFIRNHFSNICTYLSHPSDGRINGYDWSNQQIEIYNGIIQYYKQLFPIHNIDIDDLENKVKIAEDCSDIEIIDISSAPGSCNTVF